MKKVLVVLLGVMCFISFSYADFKEVDSEKLEKLIKSGVPVIDIRRLDEWKSTGIIPTSHKLTFFDNQGKYNIDEWMKEFEKIVTDKNQEFILVCRSANRTGIVGNFLNDKMGYKKVYHLKGGIRAWMSQKRKTEKE